MLEWKTCLKIGVTAFLIFLGQSLFSWDWPLKTSPDIVTAAK